MGVMHGLESFHVFNALRKKQLLMVHHREIKSAVSCCAETISKGKSSNKYLDYYFIPKFEIGQQELVDIHYYTYLVDLHAMTDIKLELKNQIHFINKILVNHMFFLHRPVGCHISLRKSA